VNSNSRHEGGASLTPAEAERVLLAARERAAAIDAERAAAGVVPRNVYVDAAQVRSVRRAVRAEEVARFEAKSRLTRQREFAEACLRDSAIPSRYAAARLDDVARVPDDCRAEYAATCQRLAKLQARSATVALIGTRGPGKTHMACALGNAFIAAGRSVRFVKALAYVEAIKDTWDAKQSRRRKGQIEGAFTRCELLIIDQFHHRFESPTEDLLLTRLIDDRYDEQRATIIISNQTEDAFRKAVGPDTADRIEDDDGGIIVCDWASLRGRIEP
jgi:DNA replication protein DnaC